MELNFDQHGYLKPYQVIVCDMATLEKHFVSAFPFSVTRQRLWEHYREYVRDLKANITEHFTQWLDGSFITQAPNPNDIDIVTFLDAEVFQKKETALESYWSFALEDKKLDTYLVEVYERDSKQYEAITENYQNVWRNRFGKDRIGQPKGFLELIW